jgi:cytochrome c oxidase assembly protein subunit 15
MNFTRAAKITFVAYFLVILAGGVVRMSGSGMGCPDWPKCFDRYVPPVSEDELPADYKDIYRNKRAKKLQRFIQFLQSVGLEEEAQELSKNPQVLYEQDFNPFNTWTEYINRLMGAFSGLATLWMLILSFRKWKERKSLVVLSFFQLVVLIFQAWWGSMVVASNITPWVLTVHMILALVLVSVQLIIIHLSENTRLITDRKKIVWVSLGLVFMLVQILSGTQIRQQIDELAKAFPREDWIQYLGVVFKFHRSFANLILLTALIIIWRSYKNRGKLQRKEVLLVTLVFTPSLSTSSVL